MQNEYVRALNAEFKQNGNDSIAREQKAYLRNQFEFFGIKTPRRRALQKPFYSKDYLPKKEEMIPIVKKLWSQPERECQLFSQEFCFKYVNQLEVNDIELFEHMILNKSWWDTVDFIATKLLSAYFKKYPERRNFYVQKWLSSGNIWLQRSALLFQLKYKQELDTKLLHSTIVALSNSNEFFINKAIGWILREYSRTNPEWVFNFINNNPLSTLSRREAMRFINQTTP